MKQSKITRMLTAIVCMVLVYANVTYGLSTNTNPVIETYPSIISPDPDGPIIRPFSEDPSAK